MPSQLQHLKEDGRPSILCTGTMSLVEMNQRSAPERDRCRATYIHTRRLLRAEHSAKVSLCVEEGRLRPASRTGLGARHCQSLSDGARSCISSRLTLGLTPHNPLEKPFSSCLYAPRPDSDAKRIRAGQIL
jgi:hypothetical protein